ncbi:MAG TPA: geranylgeranyl reductase family protein [Actinocrinis sp.]|jgi:geranylgeranyl reductase family protein|uniref:geranylgeranyl reductase family protein n=1 Tax=Actinocrinis sp. TaxID=1920516 RepID=UPI002DDCD3FE|nr:geranylgeranyl reductase family protein [Actinocrinis sp.]HEV3171421.1 geranylgeranyl reductase family protein [Actinocrinis sp.]
MTTPTDSPLDRPDAHGRGAEVWDVAVVGAGPAGATAARVAAASGARVVLLEKAALPRYKTCGGGLIGFSRDALPAGFDVPVRQRIDAISFTHDGRKERTRRDRNGDLLALVNRADFDHALAKAAVEAGAVLREGATVTGTAERGDLAVLTLADDMQVIARAVVGADGSASRISRYVGVSFGQVDLGLEAEIPVPPAVAAQWSGRLLIDWGPVPGSYGWVFPKGDTLTVGVIAARGAGNATRAYYRDFVARLGLSDYRPLSDSGHLTRCRTPDSPMARGRVLVAGDAAGLLEPWTREGISYALRSGRLAGEAAARMATAPDAKSVATASNRYREQVEELLGPEMAAGARLLAAFEKHPGFFHTSVTTLPMAWRAFAEFCKGRTTFATLLRSRAAHAALRAIS